MIITESRFSRRYFVVFMCNRANCKCVPVGMKVHKSTVRSSDTVRIDQERTRRRGFIDFCRVVPHRIASTRQ